MHSLPATTLWDSPCSTSTSASPSHSRTITVTIPSANPVPYSVSHIVSPRAILYPTFFFAEEIKAEAHPTTSHYSHSKDFCCKSQFRCPKLYDAFYSLIESQFTHCIPSCDILSHLFSRGVKERASISNHLPLSRTSRSLLQVAIQVRRCGVMYDAFYSFPELVSHIVPRCDIVPHFSFCRVDGGASTSNHFLFSKKLRFLLQVVLLRKQEKMCGMYDVWKHRKVSGFRSRAGTLICMARVRRCGTLFCVV